MDDLGLRGNYEVGEFEPCRNHSEREKKKIRLYEMGYHTSRVDDEDNGYGLEVIAYRVNEHYR